MKECKTKGKTQLNDIKIDNKCFVFTMTKTLLGHDLSFIMSWMLQTAPSQSFLGICIKYKKMNAQFYVKSAEGANL